MHLRIKGLLWPIAVFATIGFSSIGFAQDLTEAKAICNDLSADNRAMAQAAGYDIDQLQSEGPEFKSQPMHFLLAQYHLKVFIYEMLYGALYSLG